MSISEVRFGTTLSELSSGASIRLVPASMTCPAGRMAGVSGDASGRFPFGIPDCRSLAGSMLLGGPRPPLRTSCGWMDAITVMEPPASGICGTTRLECRNTGIRFASSVSRKPSGDSSRTEPTDVAPALTTSVSIPPSASDAAATTSDTSFSRVAFPVMKPAQPSPRRRAASRRGPSRRLGQKDRSAPFGQRLGRSEPETGSPPTTSARATPVTLRPRTCG